MSNETVNENLGSADATTFEARNQRNNATGITDTYEEGREALTPPEGIAKSADATTFEPRNQRNNATVTEETQGGRRKTLNPPAGITEKYEYLGDINRSGAQADVILGRNRSNGQQVAIKIYRSPDTTLDTKIIDELSNADPAYVVPILDSGVAGDLFYEVQPYYESGTLRDLIRSHARVPFTNSELKNIAQELYTAIRYVHERMNRQHRDLKPENIFVRSLNPLDLVIGDFGIARIMVETRDIQSSVAGSIAYMSPEAYYAKTGKKSDWWAMGIILHEMITRKNLFRGSDGNILPPSVIRSQLIENTYTITRISDKRWNLLIRGLLTHDYDYRWGAHEVQQWLRGDSPEVFEATVPAAGSALPSSRPPSSFSFAGESFSDPKSLADAMNEKWERAEQLLAGHRALDLREWLNDTPVGKSADVLINLIRSGETPPQRGLVELIFLMNPDVTPKFHGQTITSDSFREIISQACNNSTTAATWIENLRKYYILSALAKHAQNGTELVEIETRLLEAWKIVNSVITDNIQGRYEAEEYWEIYQNAATRREGLIFLAAINESDCQDLIEKAEQALRDIDSLPNLPNLLAVVSERFKKSTGREARMGLGTILVTSGREYAIYKKTQLDQEEKAREARKRELRRRKEEEKRREEQAAREREQSERLTRARRLVFIRIVLGFAPQVLGAILWRAYSDNWHIFWQIIGLNVALTAVAITVGFGSDMIPLRNIKSWFPISIFSLVLIPGIMYIWNDGATHDLNFEIVYSNIGYVILISALTYAAAQGILWLITLVGETEDQEARKYADIDILLLIPALIIGTVGTTAWLHLIVPSVTDYMLNSPGSNLMRKLSDPASAINIFNASPLEGFPAFIAILTCLLGIFITTTDTTHYLNTKLQRGMIAAYVVLAILTTSMGIEIILSPMLWIINIFIVVIACAVLFAHEFGNEV